jgi:hypothetical protein
MRPPLSYTVSASLHPPTWFAFSSLQGPCCVRTVAVKMPDLPSPLTTTSNRSWNPDVTASSTDVSGNIHHLLFLHTNFGCSLIRLVPLTMRLGMSTTSSAHRSQTYMERFKGSKSSLQQSSCTFSSSINTSISK